MVSSTTLKASHIIGGEINYEFVGFKGGRVGSDTLLYRIVLILIRDCNGGADFDRSVPVAIYLGADKKPLINLKISRPSIKSIPPDQTNPCLIVPPGFCEEEARYVDTVQLIRSSLAYTVSYQVCCRSGTISNIVDSKNVGNTFTVEISPQAQNLYNSSPRFLASPKSELCIGINTQVALSVADKDGDRLSYHLCAPYEGGGPNGEGLTDSPQGIKPDPATPAPYNQVNYSANYSASRPLGNTGSLTLDTTTGVLQIFPRTLGNYVLGICVNEYRNGVLIGMIRRDIQIKVSNCSFAIDAMIKSDSSDGQGRFWVKSCNKPNLAISNSSTGLDKVFAYRWEFNINGKTEVRDTKDAIFNFGAPGNYSGLMILNPGTVCTDTARILAQIFPSVTAQFDVISPGCDIAPIQFNNTSLLNQGAAYRSVEWNFGDNMKSSEPSPMHNYALAGNYSVSLAILTNTGCRDTARQNIDYFPAPANAARLQASSPEVCAKTGELNFSLEVPPVMNHPRYLVEWDFGDGTKGTGFKVNKSYSNPGSFVVSYRLSAPGSCMVQGDNANAPIGVVAKPSVDFTFTPEEPSERNPEVTFSETSTQADNWTWNFGGKGSSTERNPVFNFPFEGEYPVKLIAGNGQFCRDSLTRLVKVKAVDAIYIPNVFSPNGNATNAVFKPLGMLPGFSGYEFRIYSRWGHLLFQSRDSEVGWNGKVNNQGENCAQGVYLYQLVFKSAAGKTVTKQGTITLLR